MTDIQILQQPFVLPCGQRLENRLCKAAMGENLATPEGAPSPGLFTLYDRWSRSGAGLLITGNVMIDWRALGSQDNVIIEDDTHLSLLSQWAQTAQQNGAACWMQLNHPGRQAPRAFNREAVAPSAVPLEPKAIFHTPRPLKEEEIIDIVDRFGNAASVAQQAGFSGIQIHAAHGYLISQFLSPHTNRREDKWGGNTSGRARFLLEIFRDIRQKTSADFPISIKINSADFQRGGFTEEASLEVIRLLSGEGVDLLEISGGTYEKAAMMGHAQKESTRQREAYFSEFIVKARQATSIPLMLTGGFRSIEAMADALRRDELDIIGLARPFARNPQVAKELLEGKITSYPVPPVRVGIPAIDRRGLLDTIWHTLQLQRMGAGKDPKPEMSGWAALWLVVKQMLFGSIPKK
ncbi:MAG: NADH:flavin oxidoreductase/NADH oxidase family protein [Saprospiraceae bacterium]|nr:NADH:flavin oxidoreductase/NADH oxidase family protein [Lewinella sp.]